jgi:hypothetical protein
VADGRCSLVALPDIPEGRAMILAPAVAVAPELFTKHPPDPQPPLRVRAVVFRVLVEQLIPEL